MIKSNIFFLLEEEHIFSSIDIQFAIFINSFYKKNILLILLSLYLSKQTRIGNIALSLSGLYALICKDKNYSPIIRKMFNKINDNNKIGLNIFSSIYLLTLDKVIINPSQNIYGPIILNKDYLYFYKVWYYLNRVREFFIRTDYTENIKNFLLTENIFKYLFNKLNAEYKLNNQQKKAIFMSLLNKFTIITGRPGTGKSYLIIQIIKYIRLFYNKKNLLIYLLAPTGKATVKLIYLLYDFKSNKITNTDNKILINIEDISTLHKRLSKTKVKEELLVPSNNILDVLIIDETSMVNLYLMDKVVNNLLSKNTKLILIGDPNQLNAVASVGILKNIIKWTYDKQILYKNPINIKKNIYTNDNIVILKDVYRFNKNSGIERLAKAIKEENFSLIKQIYLRQNIFNDITWYSCKDNIISKLLINNCLHYCNNLINNINNDNINSIINYYNEFKILCLLNKGPYGVDTINNMIEKNLSDRSKNFWYNGKPIIILKNDPDLLLSNGEIGITLLNNISEEWEVIFLATNYNKGLKLRKVKLKDIKHFKTAWSITIHKAQGSEYKKVIFILPPIENNIYKHNRKNYISLITKELIYTAITRAKHRLIIYATLDSFLWGVKHNDMSGRFII